MGAIAVVIPSYRVTRHILGVIKGIGPEVDHVYVVDDCCPDHSGKYVQEHCTDKRVTVLFHEVNQGVGGATLTGYAAAVRDGCKVIVKIDGDGQMNPSLIVRFVAPIMAGRADYTKGNRFYSPELVAPMPRVRFLGNAALSFFSKLSSGYWHLMDPTNGYTAISAAVAAELPVSKIDRRFFFESDMLVRLNLLRAVVHEIPMKAHYGEEVSNLRVGRASWEFLLKHCNRIWKRIVYSYFVRDFNLCSLQLVSSILLLGFGLLYGSIHWYHAVVTGTQTPLGTIMFAVLPIVLGFQLLLASITFDIMNVPRHPIHPEL